MTDKVKAYCFSGGGVGGLLTLRIMKHFLGEDFYPWKDAFMLSGTSVGGLLAGTFAVRRCSVRDMIDLFNDNVSKIFSRNWLWPLPGVRKYSKSGIRNFLEKNIGNLTFDQVGPNLLFPVNSRRKRRGMYLKTSKHPNMRVSDAMEASMSAPWYFGAKEIIVKEKSGKEYKDSLQDGGLFANNPALVSLVELVSFLNLSHANLEIISFGTGIFDSKDHPMSAPFSAILDAFDGFSDLLENSTDYVPHVGRAVSEVSKNVSYKHYDYLLEDDYEMDSVTDITKICQSLKEDRFCEK